MNNIKWLVVALILGNLCLMPIHSAETESNDSDNSLNSHLKNSEFDPSNEKQLHQKALVLARNGGDDLNQAIELFKELIIHYPNNREIFYDYLVVLTWAGKDTQALEFLDKVNTEHAPAYVLEALAKAARNIKQFQEATRLYEAVIRRFPERSPSQLGLALTLADKGDIANALNLLHSLKKAEEKNSEIAMALHYVYILSARQSTENLKKVLKPFKQLAMQHPEKPEFFYDYLVLLTWANDHKRALNLSHRLKTEQVPAYVLESLGNAAQTVQDFEKAKKFYKILARRFPQQLTGQLNLAKIYADTNEFESAIKILAPFRKKRIDNADVLSPQIYVYSKLARLGEAHLNQAIKLFEELYQLYPTENKLLYDYVVVLAWAKKEEKALSLVSQLNLEDAPLYVLESIAKSAHHEEKYDKILEVYQAAAQNFPEQLSTLAGLAKDAANRGEVASAVNMLKILEKAAPNNLEILFALGYVYRLNHNFSEAMLIYQRIREFEPENKDMHYLSILTAMALGAVEMAVKEADKYPDLLDRSEWDRLLDQWTARAIRWGEFAPKTEQERFKELDEALALLDQVITRFGAQNWDDPNIPNYLRFNRMTALSSRRLVKEVVAERQRLPADLALPCHALLALGNAYHNLKYPPLQVKDIYLQAVEKCPKDTDEEFESRVGLYIAYSENNEWDKAFETIDNFAESLPTWLRSKNPHIVEKNKYKAKADIHAAVARAYADMLDEAQQRLEVLFNKAPNSVDIHQSLATVYGWRGWHELAKEEFDIILAAEPTQSYARIMRTRILFELNHYVEAEQEIQDLLALYPEEPEIQELSHSWDTVKNRELFVDTGWRSSGVQLGGEEWYFDSTMYSGLLNYRYRPFARLYSSHSKFPEGSDSYERIGAGLTYAVPKFKGGVEFSQERLSGQDLGIRAWSSWQKDDYWQFSTEIDTFPIAVPLRAYFQGVTGKSFTLSSNYRTHEKRNVNVNFNWLKFSDGNDRYNLSTKLFQNLITRPTYKLHADVSAHVQRSDSVRNASYFNPERDFSLEINVENRWQLYRRYGYTLWHSLQVNLGDHWQRNYGHSFINGLRYGHTWRLGERLGLSYYFSYFKRTYDGEPENTQLFYLNLQWKF